MIHELYPILFFTSKELNHLFIFIFTMNNYVKKDKMKEKEEGKFIHGSWAERKKQKEAEGSW